MRSKKAIFFPILFMAFLATIHSSGAEKVILTLSTGATVDVAPFGVEQVYFTGQVEGFLAGAVGLGVKASFAIHEDSTMLRLPAVLRLRLLRGAEGVFELYGYGGAGVEFYRSKLHTTDSLMLTGGVSLLWGWFYVDVPVVRALRDYNTDSDFGVTAGLCLRL